jgi:hypothetical protein
MASYLYFINKLLWSNLIVEELFNLFNSFLSVLQAAQTGHKILQYGKQLFSIERNKVVVNNYEAIKRIQKRNMHLGI